MVKAKVDTLCFYTGYIYSSMLHRLNIICETNIQSKLWTHLATNKKKFRLASRFFFLSERCVSMVQEPAVTTPLCILINANPYHPIPYQPN